MAQNETLQVFHDPRQKRWRRVKVMALLAVVVPLFVFSVLIVTVANGPTIELSPTLLAPTLLSRLQRMARSFPIPHDRATTQADRTETIAPRPLGMAGMAPGVTGERIGFFINWDRASFESLRKNVSQLDKLIPVWLHATKADGTVDIDDETVQTRVLGYIRENRPGLAIVPLVDNFNEETQIWESAALARMLADPHARIRAIQNLLGFVRSIQGAGICLDFEGLPPDDPNLRLFQTELYKRFHSLGLDVVQMVPLDDASVDYRSLAERSDYLVLSAYDEHGSGDKPGSLAAQTWYADALRRRFAELPPAKYVVAIANYGYDWTGRTTPAAELTFQSALAKARESQAHVIFDPLVLNPTFEYHDALGHFHRVWFLDAVTAFNQVMEGERYSPRGVALWRLGSEDPSIWALFHRLRRPEGAIISALETIPSSYALDYEGQGEVLKVTAGPHPGSRRITYDAQTGLIADETLDTFSSSYVIRRWGGESPGKIALTFDDGPDPRWTPAILDVLDFYHVPATFFVIGANATASEDLIRRIYREGHEIGNHTFTHPNIATISDHQVALEISATERLLESALGRRSILFRPPYAVDAEPETAAELRPLLLVSRLGYYLVQMNIDPKDWQVPGVEEIVNATLDQARHHKGQVVVLHDGGGDRSQTLKALPHIIEGLRAQGFELVTVSDLLGLTREAVMPAISPTARTIASINRAGFGLIRWLGNGMTALFLMGLVLGTTRPMVIGLLAIIQCRAKRRRGSSGALSSLPSVSAVVPAYDEAKVIAQTIKALLRSTYPNVDIIVVDDGSTDGTSQRAADVVSDRRVRVFAIPNGGKGRALNYGISQSTADIVVTFDADTQVQPDAIANLVRHFSDPRVGAVAGNVKVGNRASLLARWQALEYITMQNFERRAFAILNCITVVPGAIGAWRRDVVLQAGGFAPETIAEDADLTLAILRMGYRIEYEDTAIGFTEAPETVGSLVKQRFRWMYGTMQAVWKHLDTLFRRRYGALGVFAVPYVLIFHIFFSFIAPVVDLFVVLRVAMLIWQRYQHPLIASNEALVPLLAYFALFQMIEFLSSLVAFLLEPREQRALLVWVFVQRFFARQLLYVVGFKTLMAALKGRLVGWNKFERKASVPVSR